MKVRRTYDFVSEPEGAAYEQLLDEAITACSLAMLVTTSDLSPSALSLLARLSKYVLSVQEGVTQWPGTSLVGEGGRPIRTVVRIFRYCPDVCHILKAEVPGLFGWLWPNRPDDLALLREKGDIWMGSVSHEQDAWLELTDSEHLVLTKRIPDLDAYLGSPRTTGTERPTSDDEWGEVVRRLRTRQKVPAALAVASLLEAAAPTWEEVVVARTSMHDLLFTRPGDRYPFGTTVTVAWTEGVFEFKLKTNGLLVTADRCPETNVMLVLQAFLSQLSGEASPI